MQIEEIEKIHDKLKGPFGYCGMITILECLEQGVDEEIKSQMFKDLKKNLEYISEYTNFCLYRMPELLAVANAAKRVSKSEVLKEAAYIGYSEAWSDFLEALKELEKE